RGSLQRLAAHSVESQEPAGDRRAARRNPPLEVEMNGGHRSAGLSGVLRTRAVRSRLPRSNHEQERSWQRSFLVIIRRSSFRDKIGTTSARFIVMSSVAKSPKRRSKGITFGWD